MNPSKNTHPRHQRGAILATSLIAIAGVGVVAAGTVTILQQNAGDVSDSARMMQGTSVADSVRLAVLDGRNTDDLNDMYDGAGMDIQITNADTKSGSISVNGTEYGYRFRMGGGNGDSEGTGSVQWGSLQDGCPPGSEASTSGDTLTCAWEQGDENGQWPSDSDRSAHTYSDPYRFSGYDEVVFRVRDTNVVFENLVIVDGTLRFKQQNNSSSNNRICFENPVGITGQLKPSPLEAHGGAGQLSCSDEIASNEQGKGKGKGKNDGKVAIFASDVAINSGLQGGGNSDLTYNTALDGISLGGLEGFDEDDTLADALNNTLRDDSGWSFQTASTD